MDIPQIVVTKKPGEPRDWLEKIATLDHVKRVLKAPFDLRDEQGNLLAFARMATDTSYVKQMKALLPTYKYGMGRRTNGMTSRSATFGFMPRDELRHPCCRASIFHRQHPEATRVLQEAAEDFSRQLQENNPAQYAVQKSQLSEVNDRWKLDGGIYTSGIINFNNTLVYHLDRGNYSDAWNSMMVIRENATGGDLVIPEYDIAVSCNDGMCIWMNAGMIVHGVTPIVSQQTTGYRISIVWYALKAMCRCGTPAEEIARVREYKRKAAVNRTTAKMNERSEVLIDRAKRRER